MDPATLAVALVGLLAPVMPKLLDKVTDKIADGAEQLAKTVWDKLRDKVQGDEGARAAANQLADKSHEDEESLNQQAFEVQLEKLLKRDPALQSELAELWEAHKEEFHQVAMNIRGDRNIQALNVKNSNIIQGNKNQVKR